MKSMPKIFSREAVDVLDWIASHLDNMMLLADEATDINKDLNTEDENSKTGKSLNSTAEKKDAHNVIDLTGDASDHQPRKRKRDDSGNEVGIHKDTDNHKEDSKIDDLKDIDNLPPPTKRRKKTVEPLCKICLDPIDPKEALTPCRFKKHLYCAECFQSHVSASIQDENLYPPRCCKNAKAFAEDLMGRVLTKDQMADYTKAGQTFMIPFDERIYCSNKECGKFLVKDELELYKRVTITCESCSTVTCIYCKSDCNGLNCAEREGDELVLKMAEKKNWKRCPKCKKFTQKNGGCDWIYCPCGKTWQWSTGK